MFSGLRARLLASYLVVLIVSLGVLSALGILFLSARDAPPQLTWNRLEVMIPAFSRSVFADARQNLADRRTVADLMDSFATLNDVRVLVARAVGDSFQVVHDSAGVFQPQNLLNVVTESYRPQRMRVLANNPDIIFGTFNNPDQQQWLFAGMFWSPDHHMAMNSGLLILLAEARPDESLQSVLVEFSTSFAVPLLQAALVGGFVALVLSLMVSRSIARPLQALARSAQAVAAGDYHQPVAESGPTEVRSVAAAVNHMVGEVLATQQSQRDFLANVSHDLKTPLTSIQGYSQAIVDGAAKDPAAAARIIFDEAGRLNRMVGELTDLARLQAGRMSMQMAPLDINEIVSAIADRLAVIAAQRQIALRVDARPLPAVSGDGDRLAQVMTNLVSNAIKYTPSGGTVQITTAAVQGGVQIQVSDSGIGIPAEELPRIFERFYQVDKSRGPRRGTGLGLAIVQEIVQAHGGRITVQSAGTNQGTTFAVWLPSPAASTAISRRSANA